MVFQKQTVFDAYHPAVGVAYCAVVLAFSMCVMQPVYVVLTFVGLTAWRVSMLGARQAFSALAWQAPLVLLLAVANPVFVGQGQTELFRIGAHPVYFEAFACGICQGFLLANALLAFANAAKVVSADKFMTLAGNAAPVVALMVSMTMRLVPQFARRGADSLASIRACTAAKAFADSDARMPIAASADDCLQAKGNLASEGFVPDAAAKTGEAGNAESEGAAKAGASKAGFFARRGRTAKEYLRLCAVLVGWGLEDSLENADAMRARGWGAAAKRTSYVRYRFRAADAAMLAVVLLLALSAGVCAALAARAFSFYPVIEGWAFWPTYLPYCCLLALPVFMRLSLDARERKLDD